MLGWVRHQKGELVGRTLCIMSRRCSSTNRWDELVAEVPMHRIDQVLDEVRQSNESLGWMKYKPMWTEAGRREHGHGSAHTVASERQTAG